MLTKGKITLFMTLCLLSLVSIGFASWTITEGPKEEQMLGSMMTDNIINSAEFISLNTEYGRLNDKNEKTGVDWFDYEQTGYLDEAGTFTDTGHIITYYKIDLQKCKVFFENYDSLKVTLTICYANNNNTDLNIFANHDSKNPEYLGNRKFESFVNISDINYTSSSKLDGKKYVIDIYFNDFIENYNYDGTNQYLEFDIKYTFFATTGPYFNQFIYRYLYGDQIEFSINAQVTGIFLEEVNYEN